MSFRRRLAILFLILLVGAGLDALCAPFVVSRGVRFWVEWAALRQGLQASMGQVEAPFLRPVTIRQLSLQAAPGARREISLRIETLVLDLNLRGWIFRTRSRILQSVRAQHVISSVRVPAKAAPGVKLDWRQLDWLLPDNFSIDDLNLEVVTVTTSVLLRGVTLSASAIESGKFLAERVSVTSPILRQTFTGLRGATSWESSRLTIAGIPLARGLDLEALAIDLSRLSRRRLGLDLHLDTYGGTLRASFLGRAGEKFAVDLAGSASNISLAQFSHALGFLEPLTGSVRASKFTFRGNPGEFLDATASIWMEATDFSWRARRAENVMLGATYYGRRLEVDQLYVRQRQNELTVNGELIWPKKFGSWVQLPFRGQINATIPDLNGFAEFFGATTGDFSGALTAAGEVNLVNPEASGWLSCQGEGVKFRGVALDSLGAALRLRGREVSLEKLEARHGEDFLRGEGSFELSSDHRFSGRLTGAINDLGAYAPLLPAAWRTGKISGGATFDWRGDGTFAAHSGTVQLFAHGLQLPVAPLRRPLDLTLIGSYSPQDVFFRTFQLASEQFSLGGFLMLGRNFVELQSFELTLDGAPRAAGTLFLPFAFSRWRASHSLLAALDEGQKFDVDLSIDHLDLSKLAEVLGEKNELSGVLDGKVAAFGLLPSLQLTTTLRLENLGPASGPNVIDFSGHLSEGRLDAGATARFGTSDPVNARISLPLRLAKAEWEAGRILRETEPFSVVLDCPTLFLENLPNDWRFGAERGLLSGSLTLEGRASDPAISGEAALLATRLRPPMPWPEVTDLEAHIKFRKTAAVIEPLRAQIDERPIAGHASLTTSLTEFGLTFVPEGDIIEVAALPPAGGNVSSIRWLGEGISEEDPELKKVTVRGRWAAPASGSLTIEVAPKQQIFSQTTFFLAPGPAAGSPLLLRIVSAPDSGTLELKQSSPLP
ncbi:MAG: hypothetical protein ABIR38_06165 [Chthoniobacterales bacterium]